MDFFETVEKRRSVRKYKTGGEVADGDMRKILSAAMYAPSACNTRPWEFFVIRDAGLLKRIAEIHPYSAQILQAGTAVVVVARPEIQQGAGEGYWQQDCGAATENLLLAATALGYGSCWCGLYPREQRMNGVKELLGTDGIPVAVIAVGVPDESPACKGKYEEGKVTFL